MREIITMLVEEMPPLYEGLYKDGCNTLEEKLEALKNFLKNRDNVTPTSPIAVLLLLEPFRISTEIFPMTHEEQLEILKNLEEEQKNSEYSHELRKLMENLYKRIEPFTGRQFLKHDSLKLFHGTSNPGPPCNNQCEARFRIRRENGEYTIKVRCQNTACQAPKVLADLFCQECQRLPETDGWGEILLDGYSEIISRIVEQALNQLPSDYKFMYKRPDLLQTTEKCAEKIKKYGTQTTIPKKEKICCGVYIDEMDKENPQKYRCRNKVVFPPKKEDEKIKLRRSLFLCRRCVGESKDDDLFREIDRNGKFVHDACDTWWNELLDD